MNILLLAILFLFAPFCIFADQNQTQNGSIQPPPPAQSSSPVKNGTAAGRYGGGGGGYSAQQYSAEYEVAYEHSQRLIDDYVCDLDASILVVTNSDRKYQKESAYGNGPQPEYGQKEEYGGGKSGYAAGRTEGKRGKRGAPNYSGRGYGERRREYGQMNDGYGGSDYGQKDYGHTNEYSVAKAHRLRCSAIAVNSDEDCKKCCLMAARKERSMSKESIVGFIVDYDEIRQPSTGYEPSSPYRMKRNADEPIYPPSAKPEDYQYNVGGGQQNYGKQGSGGYSQNDGTGEGNYGQEGGYGKKEEGSNGNDYQPSNYGNTYSYNYPQRPKNARCVCCAPKANVPSSNGEYESGYGKGGGDGYGGGKHENYDEYGQDENNNGYGGDEQESEESGEQAYGPMGPPPKQNYGMENEYGRGNDRREGYGNDGGRRQYYGHGGGEYGGNGKKGRKYGRNKGGPY